MDETKNVSAEELAAEQVALQESKEDEVRSKVIAEFGFDEVDDVERIDKLVAKEMEHSKKMSQAIGQKIKWRTEATKPKAPAPTETKKENIPPTLDVNKVVAEELERRELEALEYSDKMKKEISDFAKFKGITVKQAQKDPYIASLIKEDEKSQETEEAAITKTRRSGGTKAASLDNPPDVDMTTEKGRAEYDKWKEDLKKAGY
jgi:hypothetical protein